MCDGVARDGSPVDVYLALPAGDVPRLIGSQLDARSSILELGSGPGRITHPLVALGHTVVAVDDSAQMLMHVHDAETVLADLFTIDLSRTFDAVVAGSHLINTPERDMRIRLLQVCRRHVDSRGVVLIERYEPEWAAAPRATGSEIGNVRIEFEPIEVTATGFRGRVAYTIGSRSWTQEFRAANVTDEDLAAEAERVGLRLVGWVDEARTWAKLSPSTPGLRT